MGRAATIYTLFRADLTKYVQHRPSVLHWIMTPGASYGEIGMGTLRAIRPWTQWIAGWGYDMAAGQPDTSPEAVLPRIGEMIGDPDVAIEVHNVTTCQINQAYAARYHSGRVFCAGDAVHRPSLLTALGRTPPSRTPSTWPGSSPTSSEAGQLRRCSKATQMSECP
jgi:2,4-dichlorophenol 6-monooxygenase